MVVTCAGCGEEFEAKRKTAKYCSPSCQKRGRRREESAADGAAVSPAFLLATVARVAKLQKSETVEGLQVVVIAERMVSPYSTGSEVASLSKEHSRLMEILGRGAAKADPVDEMKDRRERKARQASR